MLSWAFGVLACTVELEVLAFNRRAINCYLASGFCCEGVRRDAVLYPDGWEDLIPMGLLRSKYAAERGAPDSAAQPGVPDSAGSA